MEGPGAIDATVDTTNVDDFEPLPVPVETY
jgi:hypothetical protein